MTAQHSVVVVGAGISGLVCAYALRCAGVDAVLFEASERPGGLIRSERREGFLLEYGPQSFSATRPLLSLIHELGLDDQILRADPRAPRYLLVDGKLRPTPLRPPAFFLSSLFSLQTKASVLRDAFGRSRPPAEDESIAAFVRRKFSEELLGKLVGPFVSGIYAGDPERLSLRSAFPQLHAAELAKGSVIRGMMASAKAEVRERPALFTFRDGNSTLVSALADRLGQSLSLRSEVRSIQRLMEAAGPQFRLEIVQSGQNEAVTCRNLVIATPPHTAGKLLTLLDPGFAQLLGEIEFAPVALVSLAYAKQTVGHSLDGFGFLVPRTAGLRILGTVWNSSLFPARAPDGHVLLTSFVGGATDPSVAGLAPDAITKIVHDELSRVLRIGSPPVFSNVTLYPRALPQYNLGHAARLQRIETFRSAFPGLSLAGNYQQGPAIGACAELSLEIAAAISAAPAHPVV